MNINGIDLGKLRNAEFIQLMKDCLNIVAFNNTTAQNVEAQYLALQQSLAVLESLHATDQGSDITPQIEAADARRDKALNGIVQYLEAMKYHIDPNKVLYATLLADNMRLYGTGLARLSYPAETAAIDSILNDWNTDSQLSVAVAVLNLADWRNELSAANQQFNSLYLTRTRALGNASPDTLKEKRGECMGHYYTLRDRLAAFHTINEGANPWGKSVNELNALIEQYNILLQQRSASGNEDNETAQTIQD